ncbi:Acetyltransferase (GNAT) domain-containing protein [Enterovibrio norvegicus DSM 15893]|uniref:Acetyltransferase (GNAT) domain-containing protein n=1 Tax=Enterovibrio norvegicus DSM 15893 TaxID=1121869 RepID=A0A1I5LZ92_9GAMM|nr:Acetyltransferase (GNAT) domain-containing protein [Enterovibrio norvegicus DSM 15893]
MAALCDKEVTLKIEYKVNQQISDELFIDLLKRTTLGERRPVENTNCIRGMLDNSNLIVTAWDSSKLVGVARSVTDFYYCCYLSDLAVDEKYQRLGIGKQLQIQTQAQIQSTCKLFLIAAPTANEYYEQLGYTRNERCWVLERGRKIIT